MSDELIRIAQESDKDEDVKCKFYVKSVDEIDFPPESFYLAISITTLTSPLDA